MTSASRSKGEDVAAVAAGLTEAQRDVIMKLRPAGGKQRAIDFSGSTAAALRLPNSKRAALTDRDMARNNGLKVARYFLTPLGREVRQHLTDQEGQNR